MVEQPLEAYLAQLQAEGALLDSGQFEMDPVVALQKLEQFQYAEPTTYFYPLLAASVGLESASLAVKAEKSKITLHYSCPAPSQETLERLFCYAFSKYELGRRHLALGVLGATRGQNTQVELTAAEVRATFVDHRFKALPQTAARDGLWVEVRRVGWAARLGVGVALEQPTEAQLRSLLRYCPCPVSWNGKLLSGGDKWPQSPWSRSLLHRGGLYEIPPGGDIRPSPGEFSAVLALDVEEAALHWVVDGMTFVEDPAQLGFPRARVALVGPWKLDISYRRLVRDEARQQALEAVRLELEQMVLERKYRMLLTPFHLDIQAHLISRLIMRDDEASIERLYTHLLGDLETAYLDDLDVPKHPLLLAACRHFRHNYSSSEGFELWFRASTLLTRAPLAELYVDSWSGAKTLAHDVYGTMANDYRRFLVRCWAWWNCACPPEDWGLWAQEVLEVLPRDGDDPVVEWELTDQRVASCMDLLYQGEPHSVIDFCRRGREIVPFKYLKIHAHFDEGTRQSENRLAADRYRGKL